MTEFYNVKHEVRVKNGYDKNTIKIKLRLSPQDIGFEDCNEYSEKHWYELENAIFNEAIEEAVGDYFECYKASYDMNTVRSLIYLLTKDELVNTFNDEIVQYLWEDEDFVEQVKDNFRDFFTDENYYPYREIKDDEPKKSNYFVYKQHEDLI